MPPVRDALRFFAPIAKENGKTITGLLRGDLMPSQVDARDSARPPHRSATSAAPNIPSPRPTIRATCSPSATRARRTRTVIPRTEWQFAHTVDGKLTPSDRHIHLNGGFQPGKIYEYVYVVADPVVAGGGFAAIRDFASYAKHAPDAITPAARVYGEGISQNGRFLRDFLYQGFNADEEGTNRARRRARARCGSGPRQLQLPLRPALARRAAHFVGLLSDRHLSLHRSARERSGHRRDGRLARSRHRRKGRAQNLLLQHVLRILGPRRRAHSHQRRRQAAMRRSRTTSASITSPACSTSPARSRRKREREICSGRSRNRRCRSNTSGAP